MTFQHGFSMQNCKMSVWEPNPFSNTMKTNNPFYEKNGSCRQRLLWKKDQKKQTRDKTNCSCLREHMKKKIPTEIFKQKFKIRSQQQTTQWQAKNIGVGTNEKSITLKSECVRSIYSKDFYLNKRKWIIRIKTKSILKQMAKSSELCDLSHGFIQHHNQHR